MKNNYEQNATISDDFKEQNVKYTLSKHDDDLYNEENNIAGKVLRVKWIKLPNKGDRWKILDEHNKVLFVVEGSKLSKKERGFLRTVEGFNFLIGQFRGGTRSFSKLKAAIKKNIRATKKA